VATWAAFCLLALTQCKGEFTGPYPCETPYASCVDPELNQCETDTRSEAMHCGACNRSCELGALCQNAQCGAAPQKLADISGAAPFGLAVNGSGVYWSPNSEGQIHQVPLNGGTPSIAVSNLNSCGSAAAFALDDAAIYYWTSNFPCSDSTCTNMGMVSTALDSGTTSMLVPGSPSTNNSCPASVVIANNSLFWLAQQNNSVQLFAAPLTGGTATSLAMIPNTGSMGSLWVTRSKALFVVPQDSGPTLQEIPLDGSPGTSISMQLNNQSSSMGIFVADDKYAYVAVGGCPCSGPNTESPPGRIDRLALDGSGGSTLAEFTGVALNMVRDGTDIYWSTETTVWRVPMAGGPATRIAGNLTKGAPSTVCSGGCGMDPTKYVTIAVDATSVYIADGWPNVNALLKAKK
jgi:hypothetical protein